MASKPSKVIEPFDLDAARARRLEASGEAIEFRFGGETFTIPPGSEWGLDVAELLAQSDFLAIFRELLGDDFDRFAAHKPRIGDVEALFEWLNTTVMGGPGNS